MLERLVEKVAQAEVVVSENRDPFSCIVLRSSWKDVNFVKLNPAEEATKSC